MKNEGDCGELPKIGTTAVSLGFAECKQETPSDRGGD